MPQFEMHARERGRQDVDDNTGIVAAHFWPWGHLVIGVTMPWAIGPAAGRRGA